MAIVATEQAGSGATADRTGVPFDGALETLEADTHHHIHLEPGGRARARPSGSGAPFLLAGAPTVSIDSIPFGAVTADTVIDPLERICTLLRSDARQRALRHGLRPAQVEALLYLARCNH